MMAVINKIEKEDFLKYASNGHDLKFHWIASSLLPQITQSANITFRLQETLKNAKHSKFGTTTFICIQQRRFLNERYS